MIQGVECFAKSAPPVRAICDGDLAVDQDRGHARNRSPTRFTLRTVKKTIRSGSIQSQGMLSRIEGFWD